MRTCPNYQKMDDFHSGELYIMLNTKYRFSDDIVPDRPRMGLD